MSRLLAELNDLVFDRRAVARAYALNVAAVERRFIEVSPDHVVHRFVGVADEALYLLPVDPIGLKRKRDGTFVSGLALEFRIVYRAPVEARRSARLQSPRAKTDCSNRVGESYRSGLAAAAGLKSLAPHVDQPVEESPRSKHDRARFDEPPICKLDPRCARVCDLYLGDLAFDDGEVFRKREPAPHLRAVKVPVRLRARRLHGGAAAAVEQAELNSGRIDDLPHYAAERVDFADQVAFGYAADRRVAAHLPDGVPVDSDERGLRAEARGDISRLTTGVARADHNDIKCSLFAHRRLEEHFILLCSRLHCIDHARFALGLWPARANSCSCVPTR